MLLIARNWGEGRRRGKGNLGSAFGNIFDVNIE
jgi:hypothetical protein